MSVGYDGTQQMTSDQDEPMLQAVAESERGKRSIQCYQSALRQHLH